jgi:hypothetical protein
MGGDGLGCECSECVLVYAMRACVAACVCAGGTRKHILFTIPVHKKPTRSATRT